MHTENKQNNSNEQEEIEREDRQYMANIRDGIAKMLWEDRNSRF